MPPVGRSQPRQPSPHASGSSSRHRRVAAESFMRTIARHASRRLCTGSTALATWWEWISRPVRALASRLDPGNTRARRTRLSHMGLPGHRRTPRGLRESKEVVACTMSPFERTVPPASQTRWTPGPRHYLASLRRWLAGWPPMSNAAASDISYWTALSDTPHRP